MTKAIDWYDGITTECLPPESTRQLRDIGFVVISGPVIRGGCERLSNAFDHAMRMADPADVRTARNGSSTRLDDFVNRGPEFDGIYIYPPLLAACRHVVGEPFKLSGMRGRTLHPGAPAEAHHVDVPYQDRANGWPLVGCILMVDAFDAENGATRFVPGSHLTPHGPVGVTNDAHEEQIVACGPAGSMIIFNASAWHSPGANRSARPRRSIQAHFIPRDARASTDQAARIRPETFQRIGDLAKYILDLGSES